MRTTLITELLAREHRQELLDAAGRNCLRRGLRQPPGRPTRLATFALVWLAKAIARHLDRIAEPAPTLSESRTRRC